MIWIYTVCKYRVYLGSAGQGLSGLSDRITRINIYSLETGTSLQTTLKHSNEYTRVFIFSEKIRLDIAVDTHEMSILILSKKENVFYFRLSSATSLKDALRSDFTVFK